jgi:hypothetical protein
MSMIIAKRKRTRKACIPCHQRKRKCDTVYPCGMCTTYRYNCRYTDNNATGTMGGGVPIPPLAKRVSLEGESCLTSRAATDRSPSSRSHMERDRREGDGSSTKSPTVVAGTSPGIFDEQKFRYYGASAAMAFLHILGMALGSDSPPKIRSFAYNFGIRPEEASNAHCFLGNLSAYSSCLGKLTGPKNSFDNVKVTHHTILCPAESPHRFQKSERSPPILL